MKILFLFLLCATTLVAQNPEWSKRYHKNTLTSLAISHDGSKLATGAYEDGIILWSTSQGDSIRKYRNVQPWIVTLEFGSDDNWFFSRTGSYLDGVYLNKFHINSDSIKYNTIDLKMDFPREAPSGYFFAWVNGYRNFNCWLMNDSTIISTCSGDVHQVGMGGYDKSVGNAYNLSIYNLNSGKRDSLIYKSFGYCQIIPSPSRKLFYLYYGNRAEIFGKQSNSINNAGSIIAFSADDSVVVIAQGSSIDTYSTTGDFLQNIKSTGLPATSLGVDYKNRYYISAHTDSTIRLWTPGIPNIFKSLKIDDYVIGITMSPDSTHFATIHKEGTVAFWNIDSVAFYAPTDSVFTPIISSATDGYKYYCKGGSVEMEVSAQPIFGEELFYQWRLNEKNLEESDSVTGVHAAKLVLRNISDSSRGQYSVVVTTAKGGKNAVNSLYVLLRNIPIITEQPVKEIVINGSYTGIQVKVADTTGIKFQWFRDGKELPGETKNYYAAQMTPDKAGIYQVRITNECGSLMSNECVLKNFVNDIAEENPFKNTTLSAKPNPFKNSTTIRFSLPNSLQIKLAVTDILGREVAVVKDEVAEMGEQQVFFKNEDLPDGTYFITLSGDGLLQTIPVQIAR